jgi:hypothetical protein
MRWCVVTNGADNGGSSHHLARLVLCVEVALPFQLGAVVEMSQCVRHVALKKFGIVVYCIVEA